MTPPTPGYPPPPAHIPAPPPAYGHPHGGYPPPGPPRERSQAPLIAGGVVLLALVLAVGYLLGQRGDDRPAEVTAQTTAQATAPEALPATPPSTQAATPTPSAAPPPASAAPSPSPASAPTVPAGTRVTTGRWSTASPDIGQECSRPGGTPVRIEIVNELRVPLRLHWTAEDCQSSEYGVIAAGATVTQDTYTGHRWDVGEDADDALAYAAFVPDGSATRWVIR